MSDNKKVAASPNSSSNPWFRDNSKLSESDKKALEMSKYLQSIKPKGSGPSFTTSKKDYANPVREVKDNKLKRKILPYKSTDKIPSRKIRPTRIKEVPKRIPRNK